MDMRNLPEFIDESIEISKGRNQQQNLQILCHSIFKFSLRKDEIYNILKILEKERGVKIPEIIEEEEHKQYQVNVSKLMANK